MALGQVLGYESNYFCCSVTTLFHPRSCEFHSSGSCGVLDCNVSLNLSSNKNPIHTISEAHWDSMDSTNRSSAPVLQQTSPRGQLLDLLDPKVGESSFSHHAGVEGSPTFVKDGGGKYMSEFTGVASKYNYLQVGSIAQPRDFVTQQNRSLFVSLVVYKISYCQPYSFIFRKKK